MLKFPKKSHPIKIEKRFWKNVEKTNYCWIWKAAKVGRGYGIIGKSRPPKSITTHRLSWIIHNGSIPKGFCVLHKCDNPPCVNPDHLFIGTKKDNAVDMKNKGRVQRGEKHWKSKLKEIDVKNIKIMIENGVTHKNISIIYKVDQSTISHINRGKIWRHI